VAADGVILFMLDRRLDLGALSRVYLIANSNLSVALTTVNLKSNLVP
jgi:hypothetical protein